MKGRMEKEGEGKEEGLRLGCRFVLGGLGRNLGLWDFLCFRCYKDGPVDMALNTGWHTADMALNTGWHTAHPLLCCLLAQHHGLPPNWTLVFPLRLALLLSVISGVTLL